MAVYAKGKGVVYWEMVGCIACDNILEIRVSERRVLLSLQEKDLQWLFGRMRSQ